MEKMSPLLISTPLSKTRIPVKSIVNWRSDGTPSSRGLFASMLNVA